MLSELCPSIIMTIATELPLASLLNFLTLNRRVYSILAHERFWKLKHDRDFGSWKLCYPSVLPTSRDHYFLSHKFHEFKITGERKLKKMNTIIERIVDHPNTSRCEQISDLNHCQHKDHYVIGWCRCNEPLIFHEVSSTPSYLLDYGITLELFLGEEEGIMKYLINACGTKYDNHLTVQEAVEYISSLQQDGYWVVAHKIYRRDEIVPLLPHIVIVE